MRIGYTVEPLDSEDDWSRLGDALGGRGLDVVRNTLRHLRALDAKSYVLEDPYIDRDYSADYLHFMPERFGPTNDTASASISFLPTYPHC